MGIWPHDDNILINKSGRDMIAACCCIYGPRLTMIVTNNITNTVEELAYLGSIYLYIFIFIFIFIFII